MSLAVEPGFDECGIYSMPCSRLSRHPSLSSGFDCLRGSSMQHPQFKTFPARMKSFDSWPAAHAIRPEALAKAGFFYSGDGDNCVCYDCGGGLKQWEPTDDPWEEHKLFYPHCAHLKNRTGPPRKHSAPENTLRETLGRNVGSNVSDALLCKICCQNQMNISFVPCGHVVSCDSCAVSFQQCPVCRANIERSFRVYLQ